MKNESLYQPVPEFGLDGKGSQVSYGQVQPVIPQSIDQEGKRCGTNIGESRWIGSVIP